MKPIIALTFSMVIQTALTQGKLASSLWKVLNGKSSKNANEFLSMEGDD